MDDFFGRLLLTALFGDFAGRLYGRLFVVDLLSDVLQIEILNRNLIGSLLKDQMEI